MTSRHFCSLILFAWWLCGCNRADVSSLPGMHSGKFKAQPYLRVAERLQGLGRDEACKVLMAAAEQDQVIVLCRMLFTKRGVEFRRPLIGGASFLGGTDYPDWPLEPIEIVDGIPFLITEGYMLGGVPEAAGSYLRWCMANCDWSTIKYRAMSAQEGQDALAKLTGSVKWKRPLSAGEKEFFAAQIK